MAGFDEKFKQELLEKNNIVDVVGRYCTLQRKGSTNHWACCPLPGHTEKTPSFAVNEVGQFYHCFGCGKSGDVIKFIQEVENLNFVDAVKFLAESSGITPPNLTGEGDEESKKRYAKQKRLEALMKDTALFYVNNFADKRAKPYIEYVKTRGLTAGTLKNFGIGVSLDFTSLPKYLEQKGYSKQDMLDAGVCSKSEKDGNLYDFEAERLVVPIINQMGKVIAFGGRTLDKNADFGKYKNTQETVLFDKRNTLFG
ncbi:MAG: DNA primase, partial [Clostridia bacterium]|nr:DNA primase [Clostridia bacterium]